MDRTILFLYAETPIHPGAGSGVSYVDLPVQRESFTGMPIIQSSGLKGSLREYFEVKYGKTDKEKIETVFGPSPDTTGSDYAGALSIGEAKILLFPIASLYGVFAYITCPLVLQRFKRDLSFIINSATPINNVNIQLSEEKKILIPNESIIAENGKAVFNEFEFDATTDNNVEAIAEFFKENIFPQKEEYKPWKDEFHKRFAIVHNNVFRDFVQIGTEIVTRNRIDNVTGVVEEGGLWTEEFIPSETIFYSIILANKPFKENPPQDLKDADNIIQYVKGKLNDRRFQIGGDQSIGRGIVMAHFLSGNGGKNG